MSCLILCVYVHTSMASSIYVSMLPYKLFYHRWGTMRSIRACISTLLWLSFYDLNHQQIVGLYSYVTSVKLLWYEIMNKLDCIPTLLRLRLYDLKWSTNCWSHHFILETYVLKSISFYGCQNKVRWKILLIIKNSYLQKRFKFLHVEVFYQRFYASCHWDYMLVERIQFICYAR